MIAAPDVYGGDALANLLRTERVTHAVITPSALATMDPEGLDDLRCSASRARPRATNSSPAGRRGARC